VAVPFGRLRLDVSRLIMVPAFAGILVADLLSLDHGAHAGPAVVLRSVGTVLMLAFYALAMCCVATSVIKEKIRVYAAFG
jgi:hypothetical protein